MTRNPSASPDRLPQEIRRQVGSAEMARFLNALPSFQVDARVPDNLRTLLDELDRAETRSRKN